METCLEKEKASLEEMEVWLMSSKNSGTKWTPSGEDDVVCITLKDSRRDIRQDLNATMA
jgi:hypothetical protein